jgi:hypothetical protein
MMTSSGRMNQSPASSPPRPPGPLPLALRQVSSAGAGTMKNSSSGIGKLRPPPPALGPQQP